MIRVILLIGVQGSGKTWVFKQLIEKYQCTQKKKIGKIRYHTNGELVIVGKYDNSMFEGSDKLSMSIMSDYQLFMEINRNCLILLEGDRFTNSTVISHDDFVPYIVKITDDGTKGRALRGSNQSPEVIKRMQTRINNISSNVDVMDSTTALHTISFLIDVFKP